MEEGLLFVISGPDGAGKGTLLKEIHNYLYDRSKKYTHIVTTREPTYGRFGARARAMLQSDGDAWSNKEKATELFIEDRIEHHEQVIFPAVKRGAVVLCDRERYDTVAYQSAQGMDTQYLVQRHHDLQMEGKLAPVNLAIILEVDVDVAMKRRLAESEKEKFEDPKFQIELRSYFRKCPEFFPDTSFAFIDANKPVCDVVSSVVEHLETILPY